MIFLLPDAPQPEPLFETFAKVMTEHGAPSNLDLDGALEVRVEVQLEARQNSAGDLLLHTRKKLEDVPKQTAGQPAQRLCPL